MNIATLRAEGTDAELKKLSESLSLKIDVSWKQGDARRDGSKHSKAGFNSCITDTDTPKLLLNDIREFMVRCKTRGLKFSDSGVSAQLDIGIGVGSSDQFAASITFTPTELQNFIDLGLELCVSAYPVSDDEE